MAGPSPTSIKRVVLTLGPVALGAADNADLEALS